jgi:RecA-family ATPase
MGVHAPMIALDEHRRAIDAPFLSWLRDLVREGDFRLVIIDPLARFAGPEAERDNAAATRFVEACESVTPPTTTTLVAHHTNQVSRKDGEIDATAGRGVTGLVDGPRWQCALTVERLKFDTPEEAERLGEVVTFRVTKSNYAPKPDPIVLRRDVDRGGALRPLDEADLERVKQARCLDPARTEKRRAMEAEQGERETNEDGAVVQAVRERPGIPLRDLVKRVQAIAHCGANRAEVAIERARDRLDVREGPRKAQLHHLRGTDA